MTLLDVNVLIALCDVDHEHHADAIGWFETNAHLGWSSCPLTQNAVMRIMSNKKYPNPRPLQAIIDQLSHLCASQHHAFWADDLSIMDSDKFHHMHLLSHLQITDIYLLGLAIHNRAAFLTIDAKIPLNAVVGAKKNHLINLLKPNQ